MFVWLLFAVAPALSAKPEFRERRFTIPYPETVSTFGNSGGLEETSQPLLIRIPAHPMCTYSTVINMLLTEDSPLNINPSKFRLVSGVSSGGSLKSLELLANGFVEMAIVQADALYATRKEWRSKIKIVLPLYEETFLFLLNRKHGSGPLSEIAVKIRNSGAGFTIACLSPQESQTCLNLEDVLRTHGFNQKQVNTLPCDYKKALYKLQNALVDGCFLVGSTRNELIQQMVATPNVILHQLDMRNQLLSSASGLMEKTIPISTFDRNQPTPVSTLCTNALLVVSADLPDAIVYEITQQLWVKRLAMEKMLPLLDIKIPDGFMNEDLHPGAEAFFRTLHTPLPMAAQVLPLPGSPLSNFWPAVLGVVVAATGLYFTWRTYLLKTREWQLQLEKHQNEQAKEATRREEEQKNKAAKPLKNKTERKEKAPSNRPPTSPLSENTAKHPASPVTKPPRGTKKPPGENPNLEGQLS